MRNKSKAKLILKNEEGDVDDLQVIANTQEDWHWKHHQHKEEETSTMNIVLVLLAIFLILCIVIGGVLETSNSFKEMKRKALFVVEGVSEDIRLKFHNIQSSSSKAEKVVTIFGRSDILDGSEEYKRAYDLGSQLAKAGFSIVTGGYHGTMEAASKGAQHSNGHTEGIIVPTLFPDRPANGNPFLSKVTKTVSLLERFEKLTNSNYYFVLPGTVGTFTEFMVVWNLNTVGKNRHNKIVMLANPWEDLITKLQGSLGITPDHVKLITFVDSIENGVKCIVDDYKNLE